MNNWKKRIAHCLKKKKRHLEFTAIVYWVAGISKSDISFSVCKASTKFKQAAVADVLYVNKIMKNVNNSKSEIEFPKLNVNNTKLQLFTDVSFYNSPNGTSQVGQIILIDDHSNTWPFYRSSSKIKGVVRSTMSLSKGCDVAMYMNELVSELLFHDEKLLNTCIHWQQTLENWLQVDVTAMRELIEWNEINIT